MDYFELNWSEISVMRPNLGQAVLGLPVCRPLPGSASHHPQDLLFRELSWGSDDNITDGLSSLHFLKHSRCALRSTPLRLCASSSLCARRSALRTRVCRHDCAPATYSKMQRCHRETCDRQMRECGSGSAESIRMSQWKIRTFQKRLRQDSGNGSLCTILS